MGNRCIGIGEYRRRHPMVWVQEAGLGVAVAPSVSLISTDSLRAPACPAVSDPSSPRDLPPLLRDSPAPLSRSRPSLGANEKRG